MLDVPENVPFFAPMEADLIRLGRVIRQLVPNEADEAARIGLIHTALNRQFQPIMGDCLVQAYALIANGSETAVDPSSEIMSLVLSICSGDIPDPTHGAEIVFTHDAKTQMPEIICTALLGSYLFFKNSPPI